MYWVREVGGIVRVATVKVVRYVIKDVARVTLNGGTKQRYLDCCEASGVYRNFEHAAAAAYILVCSRTSEFKQVKLEELEKQSNVAELSAALAVYKTPEFGAYREDLLIALLLAQLGEYASIAEDGKDAARLKWLTTNRCRVQWSFDRTNCQVYHPASFAMSGIHQAWRPAVDEAMAKGAKV